MKKILSLFVCFCFVCFAFVACENSTKVIASFITETTSAGSDNHGVKITYAEDSRLENKGVDTQIKFAKKGDIIIWKEGGEKFAFTIPDYDEWYSLTVIFAEVEGNKNKEKFEKFDNVLSKSYFFASQQSQEVTIRTVVGKIDDNSSGTGEILVESEPISDQFTLKINKK